MVKPEYSDLLHLVSRPGDLWIVGEHFILCGDAREAGSYERLLGNDKAHIVITDPPYNVPIDGHVCGKGIGQTR